MPLPQQTDVVIIGAGAAGLMCAATAGKRGRKVVVIDHANKVGKKILMSGGGRCNFTNMYTTPANFLSDNPHFCKSALSRFTQWDFLALVKQYQIGYHEKKLGQLFCDQKAQGILDLLLNECDQAGADIFTHCEISAVHALEPEQAPLRYRITTNLGEISCESLIIATGGLSIPTMGATGFGYQVATQFGLALKPRSAGLVPFTLSPEQLAALAPCVGNAVEVSIRCEGSDQTFIENILFTH